MRTNSKEVREKIRQHILDCVQDEEGNYFDNFEDAKKRLVSEFIRVADYETNKHNIPNNQERFSNYLFGLSFDFEFTNSGIVDYLNNLGINPEGKEFPIDRSVRLYHFMIWREIQDEYYNLTK